VPLNAPSSDFSTLPLKIRDVSVTLLRRIGRRESGEPYFGVNGAYRFDDPDKIFGTCYCGQQLDTAIAETILHDELPERGRFKIHQDEFTKRYLVQFSAGAGGGVLKLADLTGAHLKKLGGDNALSADHPYDTTQRWAAAVHAHPAHVDGFIFVSRQLNTKKAFVLFDRARPKFATVTYTPLHKVPGLAQAKSRLGIVTIGP
jgi:hypothetical protein